MTDGPTPSTAPAARAIAQLRERLRVTFGETGAWCRVDAELRAFQPAAGEWSVGEIVEHVVITNTFLLRLCKKLFEKSTARAQRGAPWSDSAPRFDHLEHVAARVFQWAHPEHMTPGGNADPRRLEAALRDQLRTCEQWLEQAADGRGSLHTIRLSLLEEDDHLDLYQYLHFVGLHMRRHLAQMERNRHALESTEP